MAIKLTENAVKEINRIIQERNEPDKKLYIRLRVVGGGCSGFQHKIDLEDVVNEKLDEFFEINGVSVVVDKRSIMYAGDTVIDFKDDLNVRGFSLENPKAVTTCGCGSSFSM
jgi:iron-sulfur cluster assembly protein